HVALEPAGSTGDALAAAQAAIGKVREKVSYLVDVVARTPALAAHPLLAAGLATSVVVGTVPSPSSQALPAGADLALFVSPAGSEACLVFDPAALDRASVERMARQLGELARAAADAALPFARLPLVAQEERARILSEWNQTQVDFDRSATVRSLFEARVADTPEATAAVFEGEALSYRELDERAGRLANHLAGLGIGPDALVGLHLARSLDMIVGAIGVLKAGGAYVPLDPVYPADRIAYMIEDSKATVVLTHEAAGALPASGEATVVDLDRDATAIAAHPTARPATDCQPEHLAYVIYTSGSTGKPKGVMVEHRNAVNFFVGMDEVVPHDPPGTWLAVTSLSFDISVLELLWTLTRGFEVVIFRDVERTGGDEAATRPWRPMDMGIALWGSDAGPGPKKYELMLESAKFADAHGFCAVHTPERHFGAFGGPFPNPSVTGAAIAAVTEHVQIRASSCVLPLHHPIRVAEEWAVVDNISGGRVGISFASGWQPNDFVIRPEAFKNAKTAMFENAEVVRKLWRGESVEFENPMGQRVPTATLPRPVQPELPTWITTAGNVDTFKAAGAAGVNVLTHLLGQSLDELAVKVRAYRQAAADAGHDPSAGTVTCMLHTFVGEDDEEVRRIVREPMKDYLASSMSLVVDFAWSFPAFERPGGPDQKPEDVDLKSLSEDETDAILEFAFERYYETSGLMGTPEACEQMLEKCKDADIDEIACLIDFGVDTQVALEALPALDVVRRRVNERPAEAVDAAIATSATAAVDHSFAAQVERHGVTHLQCTPSHATMLLTNPETRASLGKIPHLMIGGEAFPVSLAAELDAVCQGSVRNMYGPTETTIWSSTEPVLGRPESISIGRPIANTQLYILDKGLEPAPIGVAGELWIGGEGVVRGYHERPELTDERFVPDPFSDRPGARMYATGDLARWMDDGRIDFLGRLDHQVKIRGYRIELGEIEARLGAQDGVREGVVIAREDTPGDVRLVGYVRAPAGSPPGTVLDEAALREGLREHLPEFMVPSNIVTLDRFPQTPNGKVDRKALPAPRDVQQRSQAEYKAPENELEAQIADVWKDVLYLEKVGVDDNFFDLGGHSLLVVQAHRKLRDVVPMPITLTDLYRFPTISGLAKHLSSGDGAKETAQASQARADKRRQALGRRRRRGKA
ncbi:MAG: MupA/Atu3671 family FMN-dependent luciferase-like monooxygenase, partial [Myxococcota bacterium]